MTTRHVSQVDTAWNVLASAAEREWSAKDVTAASGGILNLTQAHIALSRLALGGHALRTKCGRYRVVPGSPPSVQARRTKKEMKTFRAEMEAVVTDMVRAGGIVSAGIVSHILREKGSGMKLNEVRSGMRAMVARGTLVKAGYGMYKAVDPS